VNQVVQHKRIITDLVLSSGVALRDLACMSRRGRRDPTSLTGNDVGVRAVMDVGGSVAESAALKADGICQPTQRILGAGADSDLTQSFADPGPPVVHLDQMSVGGHRQGMSRDAFQV
jgi:hypothetical protein